VVYETAVEQLERYRMLMRYWCDHNVSITVSYSPEEVPNIIDWLQDNWNDYVAVSFLLRQDESSLTLPEDEACQRLGYAYLPQRIISREEYERTAKNIKAVDMEIISGAVELTPEDEDSLADCAGGACPIR
jgi:hypothetical protein